MTKARKSLTRRLAPVIGAGMLLQATGCNPNTPTLEQIVTNIGCSMIRDFVVSELELPGLPANPCGF